MYLRNIILEVWLQSGNPNSIAKQMGDYFTQMMEEHGLNDGQVVAEENKEEDLANG